MKSAVIVTPFDNYSYNVRIKYLEKYLQERGYSCTVISADFDHRNKKKYYAERSNLELLHVPEYKRNLSFSRIYSHFVFAKSVYKRLNELKPDLVYGSAPPNFLFKFISKYKNENPGVKLVYEIGDLWPETLPLSVKIKVAATPALNLWASIRNRNIGKANAVVFECDLFKDRINKYCEKAYTKTIYFCKEDYYLGKFPQKEINGENLKFAYVGAVNNIIDIDLIVSILKEVNKVRPVEFRIIGAGENKERLLSLCKQNDISYQDYGIVYDEDQKARILSDCYFGFNIMKESVAVGATMKSLEYFHWGLALINNIPADTEQIVKQFESGINIGSVSQTVEEILKMSAIEIKTMCINARKTYEKLFAPQAIKDSFEEVWQVIED